VPASFAVVLEVGALHINEKHVFVALAAHPYVRVGRVNHAIARLVAVGGSIEFVVVGIAAPGVTAISAIVVGVKRIVSAAAHPYIIRVRRLVTHVESRERNRLQDEEW
jgi:hypothetical protein